MEPEPQQDQEGADDITMNEIIRDVADSRITREEEETLSAVQVARLVSSRHTLTPQPRGTITDPLIRKTCALKRCLKLGRPLERDL